MSRGFTSIFADDLDNLISLKVSLGYSESTYLGRARQLVCFFVFYRTVPVKLACPPKISAL